MVNFVEEARRLYSSPDRHYHNIHHIGSCLSNLVEWMHLAGDLEALMVAIVFHDAVYEPGAPMGENERRSAEMAIRYLEDKMRRTKKLGTDGTTVHDLIMATTHNCMAGENDRGLIQDIDLMGFASDEFMANSLAIRKEFAHVPDDIFYSGRLKALKSFYKRAPFFNHPEIEAAMGDQARTNLIEEIAHILWAGHHSIES